MLALCALTTGSLWGQKPPDDVPNGYVLGPGDQVGILVSDAEELNGKAFRVGTDGYLELPLIGRIHASERTAEQLEADVTTYLRKFLEHPQVVLTVTEFKSQPISVLGEVNSPGVHQLQGRKNLYEVLSLAGGLREDGGSTVKVTRKLIWGRIPLPSARDDAAGQFSVASVNVKSILDGSTPGENIPIMPEDVISVPKAEVIYVIGSVHKAGGFVMGDNTSLSALQLLSLAQGLDNTAAPERAKILRNTGAGAAATEIPVNLRKLLKGEGADLALQANDILFVPNSIGRTAAMRSLETMIGMGGQIGASLAIYK